jgi:hypothetical protein
MIRKLLIAVKSGDINLYFFEKGKIGILLFDVFSHFSVALLERAE